MQGIYCNRWKAGRAWQSSHITLLLRSAPLSNLPLQTLDGLKLQKSSVYLRKLSTGQIINPKKQIWSISILSWLKPSVTMDDFCLLFIAHSNLYGHLLGSLLPHKVLGTFQRTEQVLHYFRRMKEVTPFSQAPQGNTGQWTWAQFWQLQENQVQEGANINFRRWWHKWPQSV